MNITFLIGNGFDLNLGLKTLYRDFLEHYLGAKDCDNAVIASFKKTIENNLADWGDVEVALGRSTGDFSGKKAAESFFQCYNSIYDALSEYLSKEEKKLDECTTECLCTGMIHALKSWQQGFRTSRSKNIHSQIAKFSGPYVYNFITFNYTRTLNRCVSAINGKDIGSRNVAGNIKASSVRSIKHIHGYTDKDMILALNDESQIANFSIFDDYDPFEVARLIKPVANEMLEEGTDGETYDLLKESDLIYIYGMSLGETDKLWWQRLEKLMKTKPNLQVIIYSYNAPKDLLHYNKFRTHEESIRGRLYNYFTDSPIDVCERIHDRNDKKRRNQLYRCQRSFALRQRLSGGRRLSGTYLSVPWHSVYIHQRSL